MTVIPPIPQTGEALFVSQLDVIERVISFVSSRHRLAASDADDFSSHVTLRLIEDDYAILRKFEGRSSLRTYLAIVIQRLFLDYRNSAWGKWRPSAEAKRTGAIAILIEQLTARDGCTFDEACELLRTKHQVTTSRPEIERIAGRLPARVRRRFESEDALVNVASTVAGGEDLVADGERAETSARLETGLKTAMAGLAAQDRLILALKFEDGRTVAEIAKMLALDQKPLYRRLEGLLKDLRNRLQAQGFDRAMVMEMFASPAVSVEWSSGAEEIAMSSPSRAKGPA